MTHSRSTVAAALAALCLSALVVGCSSGSTAAPENSTAPSGGTDTTHAGQPITLTIGTDDSPGVPSADEISHFADTVNRLSDGGVVIEPRWHADGDGHTDWDQQVAGMVQRGELDLALGPTWAWDVLGVTTFQPLQIPFLVDSDALVAGIVTADELSGQLMAGLPDAGVVGLSLWPEGLRHPFGFNGPLVTATDYAGQTIRTPRSDTSTLVFEALGAQATSDEPDATVMAGGQSEYALSPNGTGTANVTFFAKVNVLYANGDRYALLDDTTRTILDGAAAETQQWAIDRTDDVSAGQAFCNDGGALVLAGDADLAALKAATKPVADSLQAAHPDIAAAITVLKADAPTPDHADGCAPEITTHAPGAAESALNGTYRFILTPAEFAAAGLSTSAATNNAGVQTYVLKDGTAHYRLDPSERPFDAAKLDEVDGTYQIDGDQVTFRFPAWENEEDVLRFTSTDGGDLTMTFVATNANDADLQFLTSSKVWERIA